jgi:D-tagatose-1,6-bisphosphate aldolase subunit GatZ/KbaZ
VHRQAFFEHDLHGAWRRVIAMVVQPGVDSTTARSSTIRPTPHSRCLNSSPASPAVFEAHSTDYQRETALQRMVRDHFAILKVGPAATFALRSALQALCAIEAELLPASQCSRLMQVLDDAMLAQPKHWLKHYPGTASEQRCCAATA